MGGHKLTRSVERAFYPGEISDVTVKNVWEMNNSPLHTNRSDTSYRHTRTEEQYPSPPGKPGTSYWIGILERLLIMLWPLMPAMGLTASVVLGVKAIARYNQFKHRAFVEFFIVGTLASVVWGSVFAWFVSRALR